MLKNKSRVCCCVQNLFLPLRCTLKKIVEQSEKRRALFYLKGVIEIIFIGKFSQNFPASKIIGNGTTSLICTAVRACMAFAISFGVGYCLYPMQRQCEKPTNG